MGALLAQRNSISNRTGRFNNGSGRHNSLGGVIEEFRSCTARKQHMKELIERYLSQNDRQYLVLFTESDIKPTPESMAQFYGGGRDCTHKNVSPGDRRFLSKLPDLIERRAVEQQQQENGQTNDLNTYQPDPGPGDNGSRDGSGSGSNGSGSSGSGNNGSGSSGSGNGTGIQLPSSADDIDWTSVALIGGGVVGTAVLISRITRKR